MVNLAGALSEFAFKNMAIQSEAALESGLIQTLQQMSFEYVHIEEETNLKENFKKQLEIHNRKQLAEHGREHFTEAEFDKILLYLEGGSRFEKAKKLRDLYPLELEDGSRLWVSFLNKKQWCQNEFQVSNQITVEGRKKCRYDVTILVNGLPLVQIELKRRGVELKQAYNQIQRYHKTSFHGLFDYIQIFVISNGVNTRYFANNPNQGYKFTFNWTDAANNAFNDLSMFAANFFDKCVLGKMLSKYIVLHEGEKCLMVLRPYQYYAVEKVLDCVQNTGKDGYIWHTTGAGKTLTSFKAAQLVAELDGVDKVMFVVDRHDLDTQTQSEYEAFEPGAVDNTENTTELIKRLESDSNIIITTIQKLNAAVSRPWYSTKLQSIKDSRIVMIFDECHRSHFGDSHKNIVKFFNNLQIFGFTGTPIFAENAIDKHTTKEIFGECLHKYLIKDAIADENVLGFLVEYYHGNVEVNNSDEDRMREIAKFILNNFRKSTFDGEFDALFAVQSVPALIRYYKIFKELKPSINIGAIFTYQQNIPLDDGLTGLNAGFVSDRMPEADDMQDIIDDYNRMFGTGFSTENFRAYYDDINKRMKKKDPTQKPLDLCLVVGMFLTGFDSKKLNTLYVDKNLEYHGLLQAFSRTNRVLNEKKRFGKIICFRDLKSNVDTAIKLFSNNNNIEDIVRPAFDDVKKEYVELTGEFLKHYPDAHVVDFLQSETDKRDFILAFRDIIKKHAEIQIYEDYVEDDNDFPMTEQQYMDFRSKYLDLHDTFIDLQQVHDTPTTDTPDADGEDVGIEDIDFCLELLHSDIINVAYILSLIAELDPYAEDYAEKRQEIIDTMIKDAELRSKAQLIDGFILQNVDNDKEGFMGRNKADGTTDLEERLNQYVRAEKVKAVEKVATEEELPIDTLNRFLAEYDFSGKEQTEILQEALKDKHLGLIKRRRTLNRIIERMRNIIRTFSWD